ncbi:MAG TPA: NlpC/P60 family protein [Leucothrix mucor]|nr:NlpC/P60 family protein [Leucothrix mucor]
MKKLLPLLGLGAFTLLTTACTPLPQRSVHHNPRPPQYIPPPVAQQQPYRPPVQNYSPVIQARQSIVQLAHNALGTRYKYGGSSPREGFDCSGLMTYIHKKGAGVNIPRTAAQQRNRSRSIRYEDLQPGDMLFFKTSSKTNHVGVYIGNRQFIHAPNRRSRVKITSMDNSYWFGKFVKFGTYFDS